MKPISMSLSKEEMFTMLQEHPDIAKFNTLENEDQLIARAKILFPDMLNEHMYLAICNVSGVLIDEYMFNGWCSNHIAVEVRTIIEKIISTPGAAGFILIHNHPTMSKPFPSSGDRAFLKKLIIFSKLIDIVVHDFIVINNMKYCSTFKHHPDIFKEAEQRADELVGDK